MALPSSLSRRFASAPRDSDFRTLHWKQAKRRAPQARDCTHKRYRYKNCIDEVERAKNRTKSRVRSKVEHVFAVMKLRFGFTKVRYRGLRKNANRLFTTCALVNLFLVRKQLLCTMAG
jgi:IS5 family transposase